MPQVEISDICGAVEDTIQQVENKNELQNDVPSKPVVETFIEQDSSTKTSLNSSQDEEDICPICLLELDDNDMAICTLPCSHQFHDDCILKLREVNLSEVSKRCPICRADLPKSPDDLNEEAGKHFQELDASVVRRERSWKDADVQLELAEIISLWRTAAEAGHAGARCNMGLMYKRGRGVEQNEAESYKWYLLSANQGNANALYNIGYLYEKSDGILKQDYEEAYHYYLESALLGHARAQFALGSLSERKKVRYTQSGCHIVDAAEWYEKAATQGYSCAQCSIGVMYEQGRGVIQSDVKAVSWYRLSAEQGDAAAQTNLGTMYNDGRGVAQSHENAFLWYMKAAKQGYPRAQCNLGYKYDKGEGISQSDRKAALWYQKAAELGNASACCNLGVMVEHGRIPSDNSSMEAAFWYQRGAEFDHVDSLVNLALLYECGCDGGVEKDDQKALQFLRRAEELGDTSVTNDIKRLLKKINKHSAR